MAEVPESYDSEDPGKFKSGKTNHCQTTSYDIGMDVFLLYLVCPPYTECLSPSTMNFHPHHT